MKQSAFTKMAKLEAEKPAGAAKKTPIEEQDTDNEDWVKDLEAMHGDVTRLRSKRSESERLERGSSCMAAGRLERYSSTAPRTDNRSEAPPGRRERDGSPAPRADNRPKKDGDRPEQGGSRSPPSLGALPLPSTSTGTGTTLGLCKRLRRHFCWGLRVSLKHIDFITYLYPITSGINLAPRLQ